MGIHFLPLYKNEADTSSNPLPEVFGVRTVVTSQQVSAYTPAHPLISRAQLFLIFQPISITSKYSVQKTLITNKLTK